MSTGGAEVIGVGVIAVAMVPGLAAGVAAAVVVAAPFVLAGAVSVLVARAAMAGAEALAGGIERLGELLEAQHQMYVDAQRAAELWQLAVAEVVDRNARIAALAVAARSLRRQGSGPDIPLPSPFDMAGTNLAEIHAWCERADKQISLVAGRLRGASAAVAYQRIAARLAATDAALPPLAEVLVKRQAERDAKRPKPAEVGADLADLVDGCLVTLDPGAAPDDVERALESAARATAGGSLARSHLDQLKVIVAQANRKAADAEAAARLLQGMRLDPPPVDLDAHALAVIADLQAVVAAERPLDDALVDGAHQALREREAAATRQYLLEHVQQIMAESGYQVEGGFTTLRPGVDSLTLRRPDWKEHHMRLVLGDGDLGYLTLRDHEVRGDDAKRLDHERCAQVAADTRRLGKSLRLRGWDVGDITGTDDPPVYYLNERPRAARGPADAEATSPQHAELPLPNGDQGSR